MSKNVGVIDGWIRVVLGVALAGVALLGPAHLRWIAFVAVIPLATGLFGTCPLYSLLGINTCSVPRR